jgi:hypothetical protein
MKMMTVVMDELSSRKLLPNTIVILAVLLTFLIIRIGCG